MALDYDYYTQLSDKEIDKLIVHLKNVQRLRQKDLEKIFKTYDTEGLKNYLSTHNNVLPNFILENIYTLTKLETCSNDNKEAHFIVSLCQTQYRSAFLEQNLFNSFFNIFGFKPKMIEFFEQQDKDLLTYYIEKGFAFHASEEAIQILYDKKLIDFNNTQFQHELLQRAPENFVIFSLKNDLLSLDQVSMRHIFVTQLPYYSIEHLDYLADQLKGSLFEPSFNSLQNILFQTYGGDYSFHQQTGNEATLFYNYIKNFIKADSANFTYMLNKIDLQENDIHTMFRAFNNTYPNHNSKLVALLNHLRDNPKDWVDELLLKEIDKDNFPEISNGGFKQFLMKSIFNFKLERQLVDNKEQKSQMKI